MNVNFSPSSFPGQFFLNNELENVIFTPKLFGLVNHPISVPRHVVFTIIFCSFPQNLYRFVRTLHSESHNIFVQNKNSVWFGIFFLQNLSYSLKGFTSICLRISTRYEAIFILTLTLN